MKVYIDCIIFYLQKAGGVSVVWEELISRLLEGRENVFLLRYRKNPDNLCSCKLFAKNGKIKYLRCFILSIQRYLSLKLANVCGPFLFHSSYYRYSTNPNAINITTVHDFTYEYFVKGYRARLHKWQKFRAIRHSKYIICISENTKKDLLKFLPDIAPNKIRVIYNGVSNDYFPTNVSIDFPYKKNSYIVFVGARTGYKNFDFAVSALCGTQYRLLIVGSPLSSDEKRMLNTKIGAERYNYAGRVSNQELNLIYNNAFVLLYPSLYEGFGIPVLEAQKAGCPVIAYNASSIPEIAGNTPLLINQLSVEEVHRCFSILEDQNLREEIRINGFENVKRFSWDKMFNQVIGVYKEAMNSVKM